MGVEKEKGSLNGQCDRQAEFFFGQNEQKAIAFRYKNVLVWKITSFMFALRRLCSICSIWCVTLSLSYRTRSIWYSCVYPMAQAVKRSKLRIAELGQWTESNTFERLYRYFRFISIKLDFVPNGIENRTSIWKCAYNIINKQSSIWLVAAGIAVQMNALPSEH